MLLPSFTTATNLSRFARLVSLWGGIVLALYVGIAAPGGMDPIVARTAAVAVLMACWWIGEAVPLAVTALLPVVLFPALGIMKGGDVAGQYFNDILFLFMGGFLVALAMERWNLHRRIAIHILSLFGSRPAAVLFGFMLATAVLSMWISNTACAMMMLPIVMAMLTRLGETVGEEQARPLGIAVLLGVAYSASIGGVATLVGTPPNLAFQSIFQKTFPQAPPVSFLGWMLYAVPLSALLLVVAWAGLAFVYTRGRDTVSRASIVSRVDIKRLDPWSREEIMVGVIFALMAILWVTRAPQTIGSWSYPGWVSILPFGGGITDGTVAMTMALLLFLLPAPSQPGASLLGPSALRDLPWPIILLFGGGFALAAAFKESGLSLWIGGQLAGITTAHPIVLVLAVCLVLTFLTELTSNTATANIFLPILAAQAVASDLHPMMLMIPGVISCSMAFMLPVATPPNAIVFGDGRILTVAHMARAGLLLNLFGAVAITLFTWFLAPLVLGFSPMGLPEWAAP
jgi:sodium-dependent dicarboxylate transporter 2/3/5